MQSSNLLQLLSVEETSFNEFIRIELDFLCVQSLEADLIMRKMPIHTRLFYLSSILLDEGLQLSFTVHLEYLKSFLHR